LAGGSNDGTFTLSVWIKPVRDDVTMTVLDYNTPVGTNGWNLGLQAIGGGIFPQFSMGHATSRVLIGSTHQVPVGMWSQITVSYDGGPTSIASTSRENVTGSFTMFLNSLNVTQGNGIIDMGSGALEPGGRLSVGGLWDGGSYFRGGIDEVAFWDDVLTSDEIADLYNEGDASDLSSALAPTQPHNWYRMGDGLAAFTPSDPVPGFTDAGFAAVDDRVDINQISNMNLGSLTGPDVADGFHDVPDGDSDDDKIPDAIEDWNQNGDHTDDDLDGDGIVDAADSDDDGDGWPTGWECQNGWGDCSANAGRYEFRDPTQFRCEVAFQGAPEHSFAHPQNRVELSEHDMVAGTLGTSTFTDAFGTVPNLGGTDAMS
ncbi:MAG TPA: LamG domain-containing protein, partial [Candidatus Poseidoniales archaeon]|nr:LamG domain-containing protein [Candidatus Poseidoniales archaeon]